MTTVTAPSTTTTAPTAKQRAILILGPKMAPFLEAAEEVALEAVRQELDRRLPFLSPIIDPAVKAAEHAVESATDKALGGDGTPKPAGNPTDIAATVLAALRAAGLPV